MAIQLTKRDLRLFNLLDSYGFLSTSQINTQIFEGVNYRTVLRRLRKLQQMHYLTRTNFYKGGITSWHLTTKGASVLGTKPMFKSLNKNTIEHDLKANDVRIALHQLGCFNNWISSHYLKQNVARESPFGKQTDTIPDWLCTARSWEKSKTLAVELELSWKGIRRMRYILRKYMDKKSLDHLWYIVPTKKFGERLSKVASEYNVDRNKGAEWFMWSLFDDVIESARTSSIFTLKETLNPQKILLLPAHGLAH